MIERYFEFKYYYELIGTIVSIIIVIALVIWWFWNNRK